MATAAARPESATRLGERRLTSTLHTYETAAAEMSVTPRLVRKLVETRQLESVKIGSLVRIEQAAIERYIAGRRRPARTG